MSANSDTCYFQKRKWTQDTESSDAGYSSLEGERPAKAKVAKVVPTFKTTSTLESASTSTTHTSKEALLRHTKKTIRKHLGLPTSPEVTRDIIDKQNTEDAKRHRHASYDELGGDVCKKERKRKSTDAVECGLLSKRAAGPDDLRNKIKGDKGGVSHNPCTLIKGKRAASPEKPEHKKTVGRAIRNMFRSALDSIIPADKSAKLVGDVESTRKGIISEKSSEVVPRKPNWTQIVHKQLKLKAQDSHERGPAKQEHKERSWTEGRTSEKSSEAVLRKPNWTEIVNKQLKLKAKESHERGPAEREHEERSRTESGTSASSASRKAWFQYIDKDTKDTQKAVTLTLDPGSSSQERIVSNVDVDGLLSKLSKKAEKFRTASASSTSTHSAQMDSTLERKQKKLRKYGSTSSLDSSNLEKGSGKESWSPVKFPTPRTSPLKLRKLTLDDSTASLDSNASTMSNTSILSTASWAEYDSQDTGEEGRYTFFYSNSSPFSNHHPADFTLDGIHFNCTEQHMMYHKAVLFNDKTMARNILETSCPKQQKRYGRQVQNFDKDVWTAKSRAIVYQGNKAKFQQNPGLHKALMATRGTILVEAAPRDVLWGIGLSASNPRAQHKSTWRGRNWLGYTLTKLREDLYAEEHGF